MDTRALRRFHTGSFEQMVLFGRDYQHMNNRGGSAFLYNVGDLNIFHPTYGATVLPAFTPSSYLNSLLQHGLYAQDQIKFRQHLVLTLGGRQDFAKN